MKDKYICNTCGNTIDYRTGIKGNGNAICDTCLTKANQAPLGDNIDRYTELIYEIFNSSSSPCWCWFEMGSNVTGESIEYLKQERIKRRVAAAINPPTGNRRRKNGRFSGYTHDENMATKAFNGEHELADKIYKVRKHEHITRYEN